MFIQIISENTSSDILIMHNHNTNLDLIIHCVELVSSVVQLYSCSTVVVSTKAWAVFGVSNIELRRILSSCVVSMGTVGVVDVDVPVVVVVCEIGTHGQGM